MTSNFDTLFEQVASKSSTQKNTQSFDDLFEQVHKAQPSKKSILQQGGRVAGQFALGAAENVALPYELGAASLTSKKAQNIPYRENIGQDIERLLEQKNMGIWDEKDQALYDSLVEQIKDPNKSLENVQTVDIGIRGLAEKATGLDLHPEGVLEKAASWVGFIKDPKKLTNVGKSSWDFLKSPDKAKHLANLGLKPNDVIKSIIPGTDEIRGLSAGTALQMAEEGHLGPLGTLASAVVGDVIGFGPKGLMYVAKNPKKVAAELTNFFTMNNTKRAVTKQLIDDFSKTNLKMDAGTLTQSPLIKLIQAKLAASGLTGDALQNYRKELSSQVAREYEAIADELGNLRFDNNFQAAEAIKDALKVQEMNLGVLGREQPKYSRPLNGRVNIQERPNIEEMGQNILNRISPNEFENTYHAGETLRTAADDIRQPLKEEFNQRWTNLNEEIAQIPAGPQGQLGRDMTRFVEEHQGSLLLGESTPEFRVVQAAQRLANQLMTAEGGEIGVALNDLIKTKRTLADVANWEFGGSNFESAYKLLVGDIDRAIERSLEQVSPELREAYQQLNAEYSMYKDLFENKNVLPLFEPKNNNYNAIYNQFASNPDKLRSLEDIFWTTPRGQQLTNQVKRDYAQRIINNPNSTPRELRDLAHTLGEPYFQDIARFIEEREHQVAHPLPRARRGRPLGINMELPQGAGKSIVGRAKEADVMVRKKLYEFLKGKSTDQIMKMMDSIEGIRKLKKVLDLTPEGKELFKDLARYKFEEMLGSKMTNNMTEQVKLGTFSTLLKSAENKAIAHELLGNENYNRLILLQKNSGRLAETANKFLNASQSASSAADIGLISAGVTGLVLANPSIAGPAIAAVGGMRVFSNLLADTEYLKLLEQAILTNDNKKLLKIMQQMRPSIEKATLEAKRANDRP